VKTIERLYDRLTPTERFQIAVAAFGRGDLTEVDRLNDSTPWRTFKIQEPAYFDRLQRITWLALYVTVHARNEQAAALAAYAALVVHTLRAEDLDAGDMHQDYAKFEALCARCAERTSHLKALYAAWATFCADVGISTTDVDTMTGLPLLGSGGALDLIEEIVGEVAPDEEHQRQCLDRMTKFWQTKIRDRWPE